LGWWVDAKPCVDVEEHEACGVFVTWVVGRKKTCTAAVDDAGGTSGAVDGCTAAAVGDEVVVRLPVGTGTATNVVVGSAS
jgi:hypothetical protein